MQDSVFSNFIFMPGADMKATTAWKVLVFVTQFVEEVDVGNVSFAL